jgi:hypothetical protein
MWAGAPSCRNHVSCLACKWISFIETGNVWFKKVGNCSLLARLGGTRGVQWCSHWLPWPVHLRKSGVENGRSQLRADCLYSRTRVLRLKHASSETRTSAQNCAVAPDAVATVHRIQSAEENRLPAAATALCRMTTRAAPAEFDEPYYVCHNNPPHAQGCVFFC